MRLVVSVTVGVMFVCIIGLILTCSGCEHYDTDDYYGGEKGTGHSRHIVLILEERKMIGVHPLERLSGFMGQNSEMSGSFSMFLGTGSGSISGKSSPMLFIMFACLFDNSAAVVSILPLSKVDLQVDSDIEKPTIRFLYSIDALGYIADKEKQPITRLIQEDAIIKATIRINQADLDSDIYIKIFNK